MSHARRRATMVFSRPFNVAVTVILVVAALYLPWLGYVDLLHEETRRAVIARTMMERGDYLVPYLAERVYIAKPPLFNWLIAAVSWPAGMVTEFTARLPSVLALAATAAFLVLTVGRRLGVIGCWFLGLAVVVTGELMHKAVLAELELVFTLLVTASLWTWFELDQRGRAGLALWLPPAVLVAAAFLVKREPALVFYYLGIGSYLLARGRVRELFAPAHLLAAAVTVALVMAWLVPVLARVGVDAFIANFREEVLTRGLSPSISDYVAHFLEYPVEILIAGLPAAPLALSLLIPGVWRLVRRHHGDTLVFGTIILLVNLPLYWLRADAAVRYFAPMLPTLTVLAALVLDAMMREGASWPVWVRRFHYGVAVLFVTLAATLCVAAAVLAKPGLFPGVAGPLVHPTIVIVLALAGLVTLAGLVLRYRRDAGVMILIAAVALGVMVRAGEMAYRLPYKAEQVVSENDDVPALLADLRGKLPADVTQIQAITKIPHALLFYDRDDLVAPAARFEAGGGPVSPYVLIWTNHADSAMVSDERLRRVHRLPYEDGDFILARIR